MGGYYVIAGKKILNEYLAIGTLVGLGASVYAATKYTGSKKPETPIADKPLPTVDTTVDEEDFINEFIKAAESEQTKN
ncbi:hypothetical protein K493DRAFT_408342 [Basidiobolus meristosporus CBS 931.73]|uniref:ATP synthase subunit K, mitochondrial n=1 Tax=Basidiobolus meristosporus CBS 931.73 TaxID=1314790 RepID=A0A1Y1Y6F5_9FUNG|nr:hypothetical protein K493DRAFT_408342 [Basidiobolus meristosporus CBS 931.73]|eukprot:ORX93597.1 hypothetical protein K493DRAFT_408342 [Basidiobolus meristosporus CBS 931.73]